MLIQVTGDVWHPGFSCSTQAAWRIPGWEETKIFSLYFKHECKVKVLHLFIKNKSVTYKSLLGGGTK